MRTFLRAWLSLAIVLFATATHGSAATTPAGTVISNTASMTYSDRNGVAESVTSNTITATVAAVSAISVGTNEQGCNATTDSVPSNTPFVRTFTVTNNGNQADAPTVSAATSAGTIVSLALAGAGGGLTPLSNGSALPSLAPGAAVQIQVTVNPGSASAGTDVEVSLTATPAAAGGTPATAQRCAVLAAGAAISGPGGPATPVIKLVDGQPSVPAQPGQPVTYTIEFMNSGALAATNVTLKDVVPTGLTPNPGSVQVDGVAAAAGTVSLSGQTLSVTLPSLAGGAQAVVTFGATLGAAVPLGTTLVNTVTIGSTQSQAVTSTPASVLVGTGNVVYDGLGGQAFPVAGAVVSITDTNGKPVSLSGVAVPPNTKNVNPFVTAANGNYAFGLGPKQIGPVSYIVSITAPGYLNRRLEVTLVPNASGTLYTVTVTSLDGQLLAVPGGFALTKTPPTIANVYGLFGNLPLFRAQNITVTKAVDRSFASSGDRLVYTVDFAPVGAALGATTVVDTLPPGVVYAPGTGRVDRVRQEPKVVGRVLTWTLPSLATAHTIVYAAVILPGTEENTLLTNSVTVTAQAAAAAALTVSGSASVQTAVVAGVFSDRTIVTGRVFYDIRKTGEFDAGDVGIPGVRVYLEDGESVVTDSTGRYDFPGVRPGMHVLRLDASTLPPTAHPYADANFAYDDQRSIRRLIHGVFDAGLLQDINFALEGSP